MTNEFDAQPASPHSPHFLAAAVTTPFSWMPRTASAAQCRRPTSPIRHMDELESITGLNETTIRVRHLLPPTDAGVLGSKGSLHS